MSSNRKFFVGLVVVGVIVLALLLKRCGAPQPPIPLPPLPTTTPTVVSSSPTVIVPVVPVPPVVVASPIPIPTPKPLKKVAPATPAVMAPPPIEIHKELIPKDIEIVRVYYAAVITGPASTLQFDINGSGFTKEFEKMITVESGQPDAAVKNLALVTPNQIHGTLEINEKSATMVSFPRVLIQGKVVFQAPEPFAVVRPGEVLNLIFTEMGESGRSGRFRVFTNLDQEMFSNFRVVVSTDLIQVSELAPTLPFVVDGTINIGPAAGGSYDIAVLLKGKVIWSKPGIIRVVKPNVGQSGLIQKILTQDGFHRPGDSAQFSLQGSGFQPNDVNIVKASVKGWDKLSSTFSFVSPGRLELALTVPPGAEAKTYGLVVTAGTEVLQDLPDMFRVVDKNWTRGLGLNPVLVPGRKSTLSLTGRDLSAEFISKIKVELDEPALTIGAFTLVSSQEATAAISAGATVKAGDYLLTITSDGKPVHPEFGSLIRVSN